jgi:hypothetical protein
MKHTFILYIFGIADIDVFCYMLGQSLQDLTFLKNYTQHILKRRKDIGKKEVRLTRIKGLKVDKACPTFLH